MPTILDDSLPLTDETAPVNNSESSAPPPLLSTNALLEGVLADLAARHKTREGGGWTGGLRCGIPLIDRNLRGLRPATVTILNAEPNIGKSTLANQIAYQAAAFPKQRAASLYVSFENDPADLVLKHLSRLSGWAISDLEDGEVAPQDSNLSRTVRSLASLPLFYIRGNAATSPDLVIERVHELREKAGAECPLLLVVDYLQYFARFAAGKTAQDQLGLTLVELARMADATRASLLVIGSQNRNTNKVGEATMYGGRGSGEIEYDADVLLTLTKDEGKGITPVGAQPRKLTAVKTRFGGAGASCDFNFYPDRACFEALGVDDARNN